MSVKVAVRVRPFNGREIELGSQCCVDMKNSVMTSLIDPNSKDGKPRDFSFDFSFWSHDEFIENEKGEYIATSNKYADQRKVFDAVGQQVLDNAWQGYHCCLFAYGQTGAGKSYSMVGYGANKGIVPISMFEIFERIKRNDNPVLEFEVLFSMLEIYNEKVQDLLIDIKGRPAGGLKVREHQKFGVYVENLSKHPVDSYEAIEALVEEGNKNRTIGATMMNASSSRAHTIITIEFKQKEVVEKRKTEKLSVINLVDLAGSERAAKTGATADRLKEGSAINTSLTVLGLVISKLAEREGAKKPVVIPYRDSALTRILQNALGGNSKTLMVCAISPSTDNYDETLSTLRYADQAKKIKNKAIINESEQDKMIRELKEENDKLKSMLQNYHPSDPKSVGMSTLRFFIPCIDFFFGSLVDEETLQKYKEMEDNLKENARLMGEMEQSYEMKLAEAKAKAAAEKEEANRKKLVPHLMNLSEDPLLTAKVIYTVTTENVYVGKKNGNPAPDIVLGGVGIQPNHAILHNINSEISIEPCSEEAGEYIYLNGDRLTEKKSLNHNDRLIFGTGSTFLFKFPGKEDEIELKAETEVDWEFAQRELLEKIEKIKMEQIEVFEKEKEAEMERKLKDMEDHYRKEKDDTKSSIIKQKEEYEKKLRELEVRMKKETEEQKFEAEKRETERELVEMYARFEGENMQRELERERKKKEIQEEYTKKKIIEHGKNYLQHKLAKYLSLITEANLIAKELKRRVSFSVKLRYKYISSEMVAVNEKLARPKISIQVHNKEEGRKYLWSLGTFKNRYFIMKDLLEKYYEANRIPEVDKNDDPFWDPLTSHTIAVGYLSLAPLSYMFDNETELPLVNDNGEVGILHVHLTPADESGEPLEGDKSEVVDDPRELLEKRMDFRLTIEKALFPDNYCKDIHCEYDILTDEGVKTFKTNIIYDIQSSASFKYTQQHTFQRVTDSVLEYLQNSILSIRLEGFLLEDEEEGGKSPMDKRRMSTSKRKSIKAVEVVESLADLPPVSRTRSQTQDAISKLGDTGASPKRTYAINNNLLDPRLLERLPNKNKSSVHQNSTPKKGECAIF